MAWVSSPNCGYPRLPPLWALAGEDLGLTSSETPLSASGMGLGDHWGNTSAPGIFCDLCPTGGLLLLICWATLYGFAPWPPGHQQMF